MDAYSPQPLTSSPTFPHMQPVSHIHADALHVHDPASPATAAAAVAGTGASASAAEAEAEAAAAAGAATAAAAAGVPAPTSIQGSAHAPTPLVRTAATHPLGPLSPPATSSATPQLPTVPTASRGSDAQLSMCVGGWEAAHVSNSTDVAAAPSKLAEPGMGGNGKARQPPWWDFWSAVDVSGGAAGGRGAASRREIGDLYTWGSLAQVGVGLAGCMAQEVGGCIPLHLCLGAWEIF